MLHNSAEVIEYFGYWPLFCDAKIQEFSFGMPGTIKISLAYIDSDKGNRATIGLLFSGVTDMELSELRTENVIDELVVRVGSRTEVSIAAAYGLCGSFFCDKGEVSSATYA
jgi:hypothetical protein